ncbi:MAG TPA: carboxypeptidase-like regulatory domain-containing protein [Bacteroidales bacterium]|nr:carboxypeptidase-like regulatory domain-containing protein [Bacteroidales bacterium]
MSGKIPTYDRIYSYLKGLLSNRERHELEKDMMQDSFNEEAFEGISQLSHEELEADMRRMMNRLDERIQPKRHVRMLLFYRIAAGLAILVALSTALYFLFPGNKQAPLLTQDAGKEKAVSVPETSVPGVPDQSADLKSETRKLGITRKSQGTSNSPAERGRDAIDRVSENNPTVPDNDLPVKSETMNSDRDEMNRVSTAAPMAEYKKGVSEASVSDDSSFEQQYITGRVLGINRQALAGVSIADQDTRSVTRTDNQGNFRLPVHSSSSKIALRYNGYKSIELSPKEIAGKEISMNEDRPPINDVLVTRYGKTTSAAGESQARAKAAAPSGTYQYYKPVPAGGSFKAFENWVESKIDVDKFMELLPGNYKITINLVVNSDGTLNQISVKEGVPPEVAEEYKRVVALSDAWQPARANETPIDSQIELIFSLIIQ